MECLRILPVIFSLLCVTCVLSQKYQVTTAGCSVSKTCQFFPSGCTASDPNCRIITWKKAATSSNTAPLIDIEMRSSQQAGYIALGFGRFNIMKDADVYYCTSVNTFATAAIIMQHQSPDNEPLENGVQLIASAQIGNAINCHFQRNMAVSKPSTTGEYSYDISKESFHILVAEGTTDPSNDHSMNYHSWRKVTSQKINFTADFPVDTPTATTVPAIVASTPDASSKQTMIPPTTTNQTPTTTNQAPTTSNQTPTTTNQAPTTFSVSAPQTTSNALSVQSSFWMGCAILLLSTMLSGWNF